MADWVRDDLKTLMLGRLACLLRCRKSLEYRSLQFEQCRRDPIYWIDNYVFTSDPRNAARGASVIVPLILYPRQREYIRWRRDLLANRRWGVHAKSRDSGASVINASDQAHHFIFTPNFKGSFGSRKEMLVDRLGDPDTIFYKLRFVIEHLPCWMRPMGGDYQDSYMKLLNHKTGSAITGEAGNNIGRGGRNLLVDWDEAAFTERQDGVIASLSQNSDCVIRTSTPNGNGDAFSRDYQSGDLDTFEFHWLDDDRKNRWIVESTGVTGKGRNAPPGAIYPWYEEQKQKLPDITVAQEIDINFAASVQGVIIKPEWVKAAIDYPIQLSSDRKTAGFDPAGEGANYSVLIEMIGGNRVDSVITWSRLDTAQGAYKLRDVAVERGISHINYDGDGIGSNIGANLKLLGQLPFSFEPIRGSDAATDYYLENEQRTCKDKFYNYRAEMYFMAAERFRKTWEKRNNINFYPDDECISIPYEPKLIQQLSQPTWTYKENGKWLVASKEAMRASGIASPDHSDALIYALAHKTKPQYFNTAVSW